MPLRPDIRRKLNRFVANAVVWLLAAAILLWVGDWIVWRIRVAHGGGYGTVHVDQILLTPLKNHRMKLDEQSSIDQSCSRSIFPQGGNDPCWWLRRHTTQYQSAMLLVNEQSVSPILAPAGHGS